jgi:hypothetical protein
MILEKYLNEGLDGKANQVLNYANAIKKAIVEKNQVLIGLNIAFLLGNLGGLCQAIGDKTTAKHCYAGQKSVQKFNQKNRT